MAELKEKAGLKEKNDKQPYSQPKLTIHGDLRVITAAKGSNLQDAGGRPKTYDQDNP
jgi:hypothetical protein